MKTKHKSHPTKNSDEPADLFFSPHIVNSLPCENPKRTYSKKQSPCSISVKIADPGAIFRHELNQKTRVKIRETQHKSHNQKG